MGGGVRGDPRSGLGAATSPSATLAHPPVGGPDQISNPLIASPVSNYTRFHQLVRPVAISLETTRLPDKSTIPVVLASQQAEVRAVTSLATLTLSPQHMNTCTSTTATTDNNYHNRRALTLPALTRPALTQSYCNWWSLNVSSPRLPSCPATSCSPRSTWLSMYTFQLTKTTTLLT